MCPLGTLAPPRSRPLRAMRTTTPSFIFERGKMRMETYQAASPADIERHVNQNYMTKFRSATTCIDLSHHNLFFWQNLAQVPSAMFVRIRRPAIEFSRSLAPVLRYGMAPPYCVPTMFVTYTPRLRPQDVVLSLSEDAWCNLSLPQKAIWTGEEVEARWQLAIRTGGALAGSTRQLEVYWSTASEGSFEAARDCIAASLGLGLPPNRPPHLKKHVHGTVTMSERTRFEAEFRSYEAVMSEAGHGARARDLVRWAREAPPHACLMHDHDGARRHKMRLNTRAA